MKGLEANNLCSHGGDMLAYLYEEMAEIERDRFELHLADCGACIDDFAELSQSRYPVYEWKRLSFDPLPTPRIILTAAEDSWFDKLRASFAFRPAMAFGGIAAIALVGALAAFVILRSGGEAEVAGVETIPAPISSVAVPTRTSEPVPVESDVEPSVSAAPVKDVRPVKVSVTKKQSPVKTKASPVRRTEPLPTLSTLDDDEDDSLRLADMFDEIGTGK